ncbi:MAG TPA: PaaI family thioesterase [Solirubrobacteraceae bacterium]|nr:PaaI family thioesterase [Solirubrobacteraceae bacterium]
MSPKSDNGWGEPRTKQITWYDPMITAGAVASVPGRELLQALVDGELPPPPIADVFGARLHSVGDGEAAFRCTPDESSYNPAGVVHGGLLCMLLDSACGCAVQSQLPAGAGISTIEIKISFLSALRAGGGELEVTGKVLRVGRQVAFAEAHARNGVGKLVGHATSSIAVVRS